MGNIFLINLTPHMQFIITLKNSCSEDVGFMADLLEIIQGRRSVRNYQDKAVPEDVLNKI